MQAQTQILILMATYNGSLFIKEQLQSIRDQTYTNWKLLVRDDNSTDDTRHIIESFASIDNRITLIEDELGNLGSCQNFSVLLQYASDARYVMFADQDDFWFPFKIAHTFAKMISQESKDLSIPLLVYTDFTYANAKLQPLFSSKKIIEEKTSLKKLLTENHIYGCTMMINKPLIPYSTGIPPAAENHDYWIALVAASLGRIIHLPEETLLYRQHGMNVSGSYKDNSMRNRLKRVVSAWKAFNRNTFKRLEMAGTLYLRHQHLMVPEVKDTINKYLIWGKMGGFTGIYNLNKYGINKGRLHKNILFYISIFKKNKNAV
jgi:glycosyltransferase involved in cell wall biosynthesis